MNINYFNSVIVAPFTAAIGIYPYVRRPTIVTKYFALSNVALAVWNTAQLLALFSMPHQTQLILYRLTLIAGILLVPLFFQFIFAFMEIDPTEIKSLRRIIWVIAFLLMPFTLTRFLLTDVYLDPNHPFKETQGPLYPIFSIYMIATLGYALYQLFKKYKYLDGHKRNQYKYMFTAMSIAFIEALYFFISTSFFNVPTYYYYLQIVYGVFIAYAILAHRLMDITVVVRKTLIYTLLTGIFAAVVIFVSMLLAHFTEGFFGHQTLFISALAACLITAIFHPVQLKVQAAVDHLLFKGWRDREMVREVAAGFSHELKSPLAGLSMQAQLMLQELEDAGTNKQTLHDALPKIKEELHCIVNKAMDAARRIEAVRGVAEPTKSQVEEVVLPEVLDISLAHALKSVGDSNVKVNRDLPDRLPSVRSNASQLEIVFINLIKNALEAMDSNRLTENTVHSLQLSAKVHNDSIQVSIKDTGPGISPKDLGHIFDPYYTTKGRKGTGMGLYLAQQIIKAHGGSIDVNSEIGRGTEFVVQLPKFESHHGSTRAA